MPSSITIEQALRGVTRSGILTYLRSAGKITCGGKTKHKYHAIWVKCDCGKEKIIAVSHFRNKKIQSCGCQRVVNCREAMRLMRTKHGHARTYYSSPTYKSWSAMRTRCLNEKATKYGYYGAAGVTICERWSDFLNFLEDMGERPEGKTLDRIDPSGNYEPSNCRWSTAEEQMNNRKNTSRIEVDGVMVPLSIEARKNGLSPSTVSARLKSGFHPKYALSVEKGETKEWMKINHPEFRLP